jgi:hypothetical protein
VYTALALISTKSQVWLEMQGNLQNLCSLRGVAEAGAQLSGRWWYLLTPSAHIHQVTKTPNCGSTLSDLKESECQQGFIPYPLVCFQEQIWVTVKLGAF